MSAESVYRRQVGTDRSWSIFWCVSGYNTKSLCHGSDDFFCKSVFSIIHVYSGCESHCFFFKCFGDLGMMVCGCLA